MHNTSKMILEAMKTMISTREEVDKFGFPESASRRQIISLLQVFDELKVDRETRLKLLGRMFSGRFTTSNQLTMGEASAMLQFARAGEIISPDFVRLLDDLKEEINGQRSEPVSI